MNFKKNLLVWAQTTIRSFGLMIVDEFVVSDGQSSCS
jgi:hypothetical protein